MSLFKQWEEMANQNRSKLELDQFWKEYFEKEKSAYEDILQNYETVISGTLSEIAARFGLDAVTMAGFIDGINTSLVESYDLENITEDSNISLKVDFEKLYYNMLKAEADWLYGLPQWDIILSDEKRSAISKEYKQSKIAVSNKIGRNEPCSCGSGLKHKKCCGK